VGAVIKGRPVRREPRCLMCGRSAILHPAEDCITGYIPRGPWWERALVALFSIRIPVPWR